MPSLDFLDLYKELGLGRGAGLEEMKRAYRRRVSELHPDRQAARGEPDARLQQLTALYSRAMQFHRHHGRLPGAPAPQVVPVAPEAARPRPPTPEAALPAAEPRRFGRRWLLLAGLAAAAWFTIYEVEREEAANPSATVTIPEAGSGTRTQAEDRSETALARRLRTLELGMTLEEVGEIEGEPITRDDYRWDYGASWIAFDRGKVNDWYSSPLQPLKHASKHPPPPEPAPRHAEP